MRDNNFNTLEQKETKTPKKTFVELGYTKSDVTALDKAMNDLLANYQVHYQKLRNFHWNVRGEDFFDLHEQFEMQYQFTQKAIDDIAERLRVFGIKPLSTLQAYLDRATIQEAGTEVSSDLMVKEILEDFRLLLEHMFNTVEIAMDIGDLGTEDMIKSFIKQTEQKHWMLTAFSRRTN
jgi:starvation-inducible DNA-binding protein